MSFLDRFQSRPIIGLAPMDGVTDEPFRLLVSQTSHPDLIFTEFVSAEGLSHGAVKLFDHLLYSPIEHPIVGQLFGKDPQSFYFSAVILCSLGFDGVDINMGCPAKTVTQHGSGAALINQPNLAKDIIAATRQGINDWFNQRISLADLKLNSKTLAAINRQQLSAPSCLPTLSVKTRLGIETNQVDQWIPFLLAQKPDFITLHGRTLRQGYSGQADWDSIKTAATLATSVSIPLLGNGDVTSRRQGEDYCRKYGVSGVLLGRAALGNPWVFTDHQPTFLEKFIAAKTQFQLFTTIFPHRRPDCLRQHLLAFASGHPRAKDLRSRLVQVSTFDDLCALEADFLNC